ARGGLCPQPEHIAQAQAKRGPEAELKAIPAGHLLAIRVNTHPGLVVWTGARTFLGSILEHKLRRVQKGPEQVFDRPAAAGRGRLEELESHRALFIGGI